MSNRILLRAERGLSLIEILIALAIGSLLVLGLVEVFAASRTAYQLSTGLARVQENGRFAMDFLQRDLRMAGHLGCVNDQSRFLPENTTGSRLALASTFLPLATPDDYRAVDHSALRFDLGIVGYEANDTSSGEPLTLTTEPTVATAGGEWSPAIPADLFEDMQNPVAGSDVVVLHYFSPNGAQLTSFDPEAVPVSLKFNAGQIESLTEGVASPGLFGVSDCMSAAVFQASSFDESGEILVNAIDLNKDVLTGNESFVVGQANVYRAESLVLYVGVNAQGAPALFRLRYNAPPGTGPDVTALKEELVEGVESIQLQYGQDSETNPVSRPTGNIGASRIASALLPSADTDALDPLIAADAVTAWRRVGLVQIGLVVRSTEPAAAYQREEGEAVKLSALGVVIEPPNDTYYRTVYEDSIALRNRLFGN